MLLFNLGGYVSLEPGFTTEPGAIFTAKIDACDNVPENALSDTNLISYSEIAYFTCDGELNNAGFASTGFSYYRAQIFDRWGEKVYDVIGTIGEIYTVYASGYEIYAENPLGTFTVLLELFNCSYSKLEGFSMYYEYVDPCVAADYKTDESLYISDTIGIEANNKDFLIYPNPTSSLLNIIITDEAIANSSFTIFTSLGQPIYTNQTSLSSFTIPTSDYSEGVYFIQLNCAGGTSTKKFIISR